jgi:hypothetical protein
MSYRKRKGVNMKRLSQNVLTRMDSVCNEIRLRNNPLIERRGYLPFMPREFNLKKQLHPNKVLYIVFNRLFLRKF